MDFSGPYTKNLCLASQTFFTFSREIQESTESFPVEIAIVIFSTISQKAEIFGRLLTQIADKIGRITEKNRGVTQLKFFNL